MGLNEIKYNVESLFKFLKDKKNICKKCSHSFGVLSLFASHGLGPQHGSFSVNLCRLVIWNECPENAEEYLRRQKRVTEKLNILLLPSLAFIRFLLSCGIICLESARFYIPCKNFLSDLSF